MDKSVQRQIREIANNAITEISRISQLADSSEVLPLRVHYHLVLLLVPFRQDQNRDLLLEVQEVW